MPLRWYFFVIGPAVAVALLWLIGASLEPAPSPVRSPLHASAQSKPAAAGRVNAADASAGAKTTSGGGNAISAAAAGNASSGSADNHSMAAAPAAASGPAAANVATDAVGSIAPAASATLAASAEMDLQPSVEETKPTKASRSSRTASKYRQRNKRFAHRRYQRDPQAGGYAYYSSPYPSYSSRSYGYRNYAGSPTYGGWYGGGYSRY